MKVAVAKRGQNNCQRTPTLTPTLERGPVFTQAPDDESDLSSLLDSGPDITQSPDDGDFTPTLEPGSTVILASPLEIRPQFTQAFEDGIETEDPEGGINAKADKSHAE
jgi:hypothetical protein